MASEGWFYLFLQHYNWISKRRKKKTNSKKASGANGQWLHLCTQNFGFFLKQESTHILNGNLTKYPCIFLEFWSHLWRKYWSFRNGWINGKLKLWTPSGARAFLFQLYKILEACKKIILFQQFYTHDFKNIFFGVSSLFFEKGRALFLYKLFLYVRSDCTILRESGV